MSYKVDRSVGFQRWGVTNPWVWANYGQPQRRRGYVSPMVFQTAGPYLKTAHLGAVIDGTKSRDMEKWWRDEGRHLSYTELIQNYAPGDPEFEYFAGQSGETSISQQAEALRRAEQDLNRGQRMERYAIAGVLMSSVSMWMAYKFYSKRGRVRANKPRRRTSRKR